jgi:hypothetical protein
MQLCATNDESFNLVAGVFLQLVSGQADFRHEQRTVQPICKKASSERLITLAAAVGKELSRVPEIENVFLECDQENGKAYRVVTIINARDPNIRAKVYEKEQAVMDAFPGVDFSFRVIARANRNLSEVIDGVGRLVYHRG